MGFSRTGIMAQGKYKMKMIADDWMRFIKAYLNRDYPKYIMQNTLNDEIPVFIFHHVKRDEFADCLDHLK